MPKRKKPSSAGQSWVGVLLTGVGLVIAVWSTVSVRHDGARQRAVDAMQRLAVAEARVGKALRLQAKMERALQQCLDTGADVNSCWNNDYEFDPEEAIAAWNDFDVALFRAEADVTGFKKSATAKGLAAIRLNYQREVPQLLGSDHHDARAAADRILRTATDLNTAVDELQNVVLAHMT